MGTVQKEEVFTRVGDGELTEQAVNSVLQSFGDDELSVTAKEILTLGLEAEKIVARLKKINPELEDLQKKYARGRRELLKKKIKKQGFGICPYCRKLLPISTLKPFLVAATYVHEGCGGGRDNWEPDRFYDENFLAFLCAQCIEKAGKKERVSIEYRALIVPRVLYPARKVSRSWQYREKGQWKKLPKGTQKWEFFPEDIDRDVPEWTEKFQISPHITIEPRSVC
jgi:hypothetical protein